MLASSVARPRHVPLPLFYVTGLDFAINEGGEATGTAAACSDASTPTPLLLLLSLATAPLPKQKSRERNITLDVPPPSDVKAVCGRVRVVCEHTLCCMTDRVADGCLFAR
jgi:hypothetical protein